MSKALIWIGATTATIAIAAIVWAYGAGRNASDEVELTPAAYEMAWKGTLKAYCGQFQAAYGPYEHINSKKQVDAACDCFADNMFEAHRDVRPERVDEFIKQLDIKPKAKAVYRKCGQSAGLN